MSGTSPLRVAVFGAGPSGFYAVEDLLKQTAANGQTIAVDLFDRLPTPYGLVRGGVAPDHQKIKAVIRQYDKTANRPGFRFFGNVAFGSDVTIDEMLAHYHQVLFTTGAESLKGKSIRRDPRVCLCIDDERPPFSFVVVEGKVELSEDPDELLLWATRIGGRYMGQEKAQAYGRRNAVPGELLVRLRPTHVVARAAIAD